MVGSPLMDEQLRRLIRAGEQVLDPVRSGGGVGRAHAQRAGAVGARVSASAAR